MVQVKVVDQQEELYAKENGTSSYRYQNTHIQ